VLTISTLTPTDTLVYYNTPTWLCLLASRHVVFHPQESFALPGSRLPLVNIHQFVKEIAVALNFYRAATSKLELILS
jgi:hypothetical protein